jgi:DNA-binding CsgD family transcriptional regulator
VLCSGIVGRERELSALQGALDAVGTRHGGVMFVLGEPGIGKSRLAREIVAEAERRGMASLRGRAVHATSPAAYRPFAEALCTVMRAGGPPETPELAPFRAALARLVPEWRVERVERADDSVVVLAEAVLRFLRAVAAGRGCVLVLEDLHWADPETLAIVEYLADNLRSEPVVCVVTLRADDHTPALELARRLGSGRVSPVFDLPRLDEREIEQMVSACLESSHAPREVLAFVARAEGVPFLIEELLAATVASGALVHDGHAWTFSASVDAVVPLTFRDGVRRRLGPLGAEARQVLQATAVLGRRFDWSLLPVITGITGLAEDAILRALHAAVDAQLVVVEAGDPEFQFRHALTRDAVLHELLPPERAELSRRALEAIETAYPELPGAWCELAAELAEAAGNRARAASLLLRVGCDALERGALASAEVALDRARAFAPRDDRIAVDIEESLAEVLSLAGKRDRAFDVSASLLDRLDEQADAGVRRTEAHLRLARVAIAATDWTAAREQLANARAGAAQTRDDRLGARIDALAAHVAMGEHRVEEAASLAEAALANADRVQLPEVACEALEILGRCARPRDLDGAERAFARAYAIAEEHGLTVWSVRALHELGTIDLLRGTVVDRLEQARARAVSVGALATTAVIDVQLAATLTSLGEMEAELAVARRAADLARRYGLELTFAAARAFEGHAHAYARERREMEECFADAAAHGRGDPGIAVIILTGAGNLALAEEDRPEALRKLGEAAAVSWESPGDQTTGPSAGFFALVRAVDEPRRDRVLPDAPPWWRPVHFLARAWCCYAEAVVVGRRGDGREATALVAAGDAQLERSEWNRQLGRRLVAEAALADGWGEPVSWLREALAYFEQRADDPIAGACRSLLRKAGASVPRHREGSESVPPPLRSMGVTARESEVLALLSEGLSNKEIGARLYLSPRTVERHIANLAVKTGVERRAQLVALAARVAGDAR